MGARSSCAGTVAKFLAIRDTSTHTMGALSALGRWAGAARQPSRTRRHQDADQAVTLPRLKFP